MPPLCILPVAAILLTAILIWFLAALAGQLDDAEEQQGVRRS